MRISLVSYLHGQGDQVQLLMLRNPKPPCHQAEPAVPLPLVTPAAVG